MAISFISQPPSGVYLSKIIHKECMILKWNIPLVGAEWVVFIYTERPPGIMIINFFQRLSLCKVSKEF